jgi:hypothetical protein
MVRKLGCRENDASQALEILQINFLVQDTEIPDFYRITILGIDIFERGLPLVLFNNKLQERKMILEFLLDPYQKDTKQYVHSDELMKRIKNSDRYYLSGNVEYLEQKGSVKLSRFHGGKYFVRLTAKGFLSIQDVTVDNARVMSSAYEILFRLENRLRRFLESKLGSRYGQDWWEKYVTFNVKQKVNDKKEAELKLSWQVSQDRTNTVYLLFEDLEKIIIRNWDEVFKSVFHDQHSISLRFGELVEIRNSIAHTRMLSQEGMIRLNQYSQDLINMVEPASS